ncbi:acyltransferase family protein [Bradyrhizobium erythrophlei]|uniref:Peptidoglycan/LPS O-acetylase OafA/YrhL, contains acyltransferase and SGNH-hydrolase domains n=1 Tax=Bradyrhizobium erythrophlei TaxID=1437360 RepID=A0A1M7UHE1_9BRAD|nr:acyltransferase family protein [Bradyrhizobium erythrophlei]SHN82325.1 Peptidoglycan/LPS O-acetylase OafA/YrhL, contains acyltransferase and SGNH-hydrolase domains [Bradyrhizobium erythrophlei]
MAFAKARIQGIETEKSIAAEQMAFDTSFHVKENYRPDIDGLRAFAVVSVVLYHAFPKAVRGGYIGVDVFFVISGFLISSILLKEMSDRSFTFSRFYGRRVRRIFPALAVCLTGVLAYGFVCLLPSEFMQLGKHVFFGAAFLSNIAIWSEAGYFDIAATLKPLLHLWSLGIEEQFYIVWPALLWTIFQTKASLGRLLVLMFLASFAINIWLSSTSIVGDFFLPFPRFWELLLGAGLAYQNQVVLAPATRSWLSLAGLVALLTSAAFFTPELRFPGWLAPLPVAGAAALIFAGPEAVVNRWFLSDRRIVFVGLISYPLYLWHWPLISYAYIIRLGKPPTPLMAAGLVVASFVLAWMTYRLVERPIRFGTHPARGTRVVAIWVAALGVVGLTTWTLHGFPGRFPALPSLDIRKISEARNDPVFQATQGMDVQDYDHTWIAHLGQGERKLALSGDSLLFQFGPRLQHLADTGQLRANTYFVVGGSCAPVPGIIQQGDFAHCANMPDLLLELVQREGIANVVLGASWAGYRDTSLGIQRGGKRLSLGTVEGREAFYANLEDYIRLLQRSKANVYLILGPPIQGVRFDPNKMVIRSPIGFSVAPDVDKDVPIAELRAGYADIDNDLRRIAERTGATTLDAFPDICGNSDGCSPFYAAAEPKYSDGMHLRPSFVQRHVHFLDFLLE